MEELPEKSNPGAPPPADTFKQRSNRKVLWVDKEYSPKEAIRLIRACDLVREHSSTLSMNERYRLLDIGCGTGPLRTYLEKEHFEIIGLEIGEESRAIAKERYDDCLAADLECPWPVKNNSFDAVHAGALLEHVADWHAPLNRANAALKEDGLLVVSVPNLRYWKELKRLVFGKQPHWLKDIQHVHGYTPKFLQELIRIHGFEITSMEADRVNFPLLSDKWSWVTRKLAAFGSVIIVGARLKRRVRVEDHRFADEVSESKDVGLRSIEVTRE